MSLQARLVVHTCNLSYLGVEKGRTQSEHHKTTKKRFLQPPDSPHCPFLILLLPICFLPLSLFVFSSPCVSHLPVAPLGVREPWILVTGGSILSLLTNKGELMKQKNNRKFQVFECSYINSMSISFITDTDRRFMPSPFVTDILWFLILFATLIKFRIT